MKFHNAGKYNGDETSLPQRQHPINSVAFKEFSDMQQLTTYLSIGSIVLIIGLGIPVFLLGKQYLLEQVLYIALACILTIFVIVPHELLHAICFQKDVYMYNNIAQGMFFVVGNEDMSKKRFVCMCLLPNLVLGLLPYTIFLFNPSLVYVGVFGALNIGSGIGDYMNVYNALRQVPNHAMIYMSGMHNYWYKENR